MIEKMIINNFKGIDYLEYKPKMINLIIGKNNTGKTSLLESIDVLTSAEKIKKHYKKHLSALINVRSHESKIMLTLEDKDTQVTLKKPNTQTTVLEFKRQLIKNIKKIEKIDFTENMDKEIENILNTQLTEEIILELSKESVLVIKDGKEEAL